jgi:uncharacterized membrane protein YuzA (DUF378 family)
MNKMNRQNRTTVNVKENEMKSIDVVVATLLVVGGLNWGLVGLLHFNLVATLLGDATLLSRLVYAVVGLCALYQVVQWKAIQRRWAVSAERA